MKRKGSKISVILGTLKECKSSEDVKRLQYEAGELAASNIYLANLFLSMYTKLGSLTEARNLFDSMHSHTVVSWTTLIRLHADNNEEAKALSLFSQMQRESCSPNERTYVAVVRACTGLASKERSTRISNENVKLGSLEKGIEVHSHARQAACLSDTFLANSLLDMYVKCGSLLDARKLFDTMACHTVVSWTTLVLGYADNGKEELAVELFHAVTDQGCQPNARTYVAVLKACTGLASREPGSTVDGKTLKVETLRKGTSIHSQAIRDGFALDIFVSNTLVDVYGKCGSCDRARQLFDRMPAHGIVSWNALMLGYANNCKGEVALELFHWLVRERSCSLTPGTFVAALKACISLASDEELLKANSLEKGRFIHLEATRCGYELELSVGTTLVEMYSACGSMADACNVFWRLPARSTVSWNGLVHGYAQNGQGEQALQAFAQMQYEGCLPDSRSFVAAVKACTCLQGRQVDGRVSLKRGLEFHSLAVETGYDQDEFVACSLIDMFAKCASLEAARHVFRNVPYRDVVLWNSVISGHAEVDGAASFTLFEEMKAEGWRPDCSTYIAVLRACGSLLSLHKTRDVHAEICRRGMENEEALVNCLLDVYAKCGSLLNVNWTFDSLSRTNMVTWNTVLAGHSRQGNAEEVLRLFKVVLELGLKPNGVTLLCLLSACSHAGLVEQGRELFEGMARVFGVSRSIKHYHCMADLLGRREKLEEMITLVQNMPYEPNAVTWTTVLAACDKWKNVEAGKVAFELCSKAKLEDSGGAYVLMRNISLKS